MRRYLGIFLVMSLILGMTLDSAEARRRRKRTPSEPPEKRLYERLGGRPVLQKVVGEFVVILMADERLKEFFGPIASDKKRVARLKASLEDQLCQLASGPCKYKGQSMKQAHGRMKIQATHFNFYAENLLHALEKNAVPEREKNQLMAALGSMRSEIISSQP